MEITARIRIPDHIYRFYAEASRCIHGRTPEDVMADVLTAYVGMLNRNTACCPDPEVSADPGALSKQ